MVAEETRLHSGERLKISKAYLLGIRKEPFKLVRPALPAPKKPHGFTEMILTPGATFEWIASDGRKGLVTRSLTAANLAMLPSEVPVKKTSSDAAAAPPTTASPQTPRNTPVTPTRTTTTKNTKKDMAVPSIQGGSDNGYGIGGLWGKLQAEKERQDAEETWTTANDARLLEMKNDNLTWKDIAEELGRAQYECKERFKIIKPADWKPTSKAAKGGKQGGKGKVSENAVAAAAVTAPAAATQNVNPFANTNANAPPPSWNNNAAPITANTTTAAAAQQPPWTCHTTYTAPTAQALEAPYNHANAKSAKAPTILYGFTDVPPDKTFSMDELVTIAKIIQEDRERMWLRVSSRFLDKTNRRIHPDLIKQTFTGAVQGAGSAKGTEKEARKGKGTKDV
ncbi:hypothetical protein CC78DRAFT_583809 [Lojkania enalia]|uniref:Myb-like domain-containing protein n=1 Tax=Lojkania enalia TaxID=147567 RepID=A0A9P4N735_9PLEO|nr:hypothetical protein CC78DRAFT_583809 [Didymosphaeria enalia]